MSPATRSTAARTASTNRSKSSPDIPGAWYHKPLSSKRFFSMMGPMKRVAVIIVTQLRGEAGPRQVDGARVGLVHTLGGNTATVLVSLFGLE